MVGGTNFVHFFSNFVLTFLTGTASEDFFKMEILFIQLFFLFLLLVISFLEGGGYLILLFIQFFSVLRVYRRLLEFFGTILDPFFPDVSLARKLHHFL